MKKSISAENYLKNILNLQLKNGHVRAVDLALEIGVSKPSVRKNFLTSIGVNEKTASEEACLIEHDIGEETYASLEELYERGFS